MLDYLGFGESGSEDSDNKNYLPLSTFWNQIEISSAGCRNGWFGL